MFLGLDFLNLDNFNENINCIGNIQSVQLKNLIVDQMSIRGNTNVVYSSIKDNTWNYDEILVTDFINSLEAGNISNAGVPIVSLIYMRKKTTDLAWEKIITIPFIIGKSAYQFIDHYVASNVSYDYAVVPTGVSGVQGSWIISTIIPSFEGTFIFDDSNNFHLLNNLKWDAITTKTSKGTYEPMGSQFPIIIYGSMKYKTGKVTNTLMTDNSINQLGTGIAGIDLLQERVQTDAFMDFLTNFCAKVLKDGQGRYYLISITGDPTETPNNDVKGAISDVAFEFTEMGKPTAANLASVNLGNIV